MASLLLTPGATVKAVDEDRYDILAIPFGGPLGGKDTDGEYFSPRTDLKLGWYPESRPLLYHHGLDDGPGADAIGRVDSRSARKEEDGWWVAAQLDKQAAYYARIKQLLERGALFGSSGGYAPNVKIARGGEILVWPWCEQSLTPTPANLYSLVGPASAEKHYKAADLDAAGFAKAALDAAALDRLGDDDFAYIDSDGGRHLPIHDAAHVRAALARFGQTRFEDAAARRAAARKVLAAAKRLGIDVSDGSAVAEAAKHAKLDQLPANWGTGARAGLSAGGLARLSAAAGRLDAALSRAAAATKDGRVLSDANARRARAVHDQARDMLASAGVDACAP